MPRRVVTPEMGQRILELAAQGRSLAQTAAVLHAEFGVQVDPSTVRQQRKTLKLRGVVPLAKKGKPAKAKVPSAPKTEIETLKANAARLEAALAVATMARDLTSLSAEHRKTLAAIRAAEAAQSSGGDSNASEIANALRTKLEAFLPASPPSFAETDASRPTLSVVAGSAGGGSAR